MFESIDDHAVARGLFDAAATWLKSQGFPEMLGPLNFSTNYECSVLVEGFEASPAVMMAYNPRYYPALYEGCGFTKAKDLFAFDLSSSAPPPEKVVRVAEKIRQRNGVVVRAVRMSDFSAEVQRVKDIYNAAWEKNWGFVPMTEAEFDHLAKEMKPLVVPELLLIAEVKGQPVAFSMTIPDANFALKAAGGRLTKFGLPIGLVKMVLASRRIRRLRLITLGDQRRTPTSGTGRHSVPGHHHQRPTPRLQRRGNLLDPRRQRPRQPRHRVDGGRAFEDLPPLPAPDWLSSPLGCVSC